MTSFAYLVDANLRPLDDVDPFDQSRVDTAELQTIREYSEVN